MDFAIKKKILSIVKSSFKYLFRQQNRAVFVFPVDVRTERNKAYQKDTNRQTPARIQEKYIKFCH